jgi:preprotein translocase subunit SecG
MESVILVIHLIVALAIIVVVLIQPSEAGGFVGGGNMTGMLRPKTRGDILTKITMILAGTFFLTSLTMAIISKNRAPEADILQLANEAAPAAAAVDAKTTAPEAAKTEAAKKVEPAKAQPKKAEKPKAPISK